MSIIATESQKKDGGDARISGVSVYFKKKKHEKRKISCENRWSECMFEKQNYKIKKTECFKRLNFFSFERPHDYL